MCAEDTLEVRKERIGDTGENDRKDTERGRNDQSISKEKGEVCLLETSSFPRRYGGNRGRVCTGKD